MATINLPMPDGLRKRCLAEVAGTFAIVFFGCGAVALIPGNALAINVVFGLAVGAMVYALGPISAAHFNPAVTLGFAVARRFPWRFVVPYIVAQCVGAIAASALHALLIPAAATRVAYGGTSTALSFVPAGVIEILLTLVLMAVIMASATDRRVPGWVPPVAIGLTVTLCGLVGGPLTGCSMNPARSLGPALFAGGTPLSQLWLYLLFPSMGAMLSARLFEALRQSEVHAQCAPNALSAGQVAPWPGGPCC